jgi:hypothetical protein
MTAEFEDDRERQELTCNIDEWLRLERIQQGLRERIRQSIRFVESKGGVGTLRPDQRAAYEALRAEYGEERAVMTTTVMRTCTAWCEDHCDDPDELQSEHGRWHYTRNVYWAEPDDGRHMVRLEQFENDHETGPCCIAITGTSEAGSFDLDGITADQPAGSPRR